MASQGDDPPIREGGNESTLEIFLFTNGQQESPPRKYNVRVNDRWDTTLNFLARSQSGSNHNIELYTTEGKKIEKGVELTRGEAYVAVEPPQVFIPAGYHDYLMKASRSREKRQEKVTESDSSIKAKDKTSSKTKMEEGNKDATNIKIIQDITIHSTSRTAIEEQDGFTNKVKTDIAKAVKPIRRISLKPTQKRNNSLPQQNPNIVRKNNVTPPIKRGSNLSKIDAAKKKVEISSIQSNRNSIVATKDELIVTKAIVNNPKDKEASVTRVISHTRDVIETYELLNPTDVANVPGGNATYKPTQNLLIVDSSVAETNVLLPVTQEKARESAYIIPVKIRSLTDIFTTKRDTVSIHDQDIKNIPDILNSSPLGGSRHTGFPKGGYGTESKVTVVSNVPNDPSQQKTSMFGGQTGDNNFSIYVKQGDTVKLKLNIDVKNVSSTTFEANYDHSVKPTLSVETGPLMKSDCDTRKDLPAAKTFREAPTLTEPWLAGVGLPYEYLQQKTNDLYQCKCCSCPKNLENVAPVYVDNNNYFILLPPEESKGHLVSCSCKLQINQQSKCEIPDIQVLSRNGNNVAKLEEGKHTPVHETNVTGSSEISKNNLVYISSKENQLSSQKASITEKEAPLCDCCVCSVQDQMVVCHCPQRLSTTSSSSSDIAKQPAMANSSRVFKDAYTQTDWSGIVLEARPLEDGSYAFHIPSLKLLKTTNSLYQ